MGGRRSTATAVSAVEEFRCAPCAQSELNARYQQARAAARLPGETLAPFQVPGIPAAIGYARTLPGSLATVVAFSEGDFYYRILTVSAVGDPSRPARSQLIAAATALYRESKVSPR